MVKGILYTIKISMEKINRISFSDFLKNKKKIIESKISESIDKASESEKLSNDDKFDVFSDLLKKNNIKYGYLSVVPHGASSSVNGENIDFKIGVDKFDLNYDNDILLYKNGDLLLTNPTEDEFKEIITTKLIESDESTGKTDSEILTELIEGKNFINKREEDTQLMTKLLDILVDPSVKDGVKQLALDKCKEYLELTFINTDIDECYFQIKESFKQKEWQKEIISEDVVNECFQEIAELLAKITDEDQEVKTSDIDAVCSKIRNSNYKDEIKDELCNRIYLFNENWFSDLNKAKEDWADILTLAE